MTLRLRQTSEWIFSVDFNNEVVSKNLHLEQNEIWSFLEFLEWYSSSKEKLKEWIKAYWFEVVEEWLSLEMTFDDIIYETRDVILRMKNK